MGKEQDLLDASRSGHYSIVEKILSSRIKKSGPLTLTRYEHFLFYFNIIYVKQSVSTNIYIYIWIH